MKIQFALLKILKTFRISQATLAKESGVGSDLINKLIKGERDNPTFETVERLANGLYKIDPLAKGMLYYALSELKDDAYVSNPTTIKYQLKEPHEHPEVIELFIKFFISRGLISQDKLDAETNQVMNQGFSDVLEYYSALLQNHRTNNIPF